MTADTQELMKTFMELYDDTSDDDYDADVTVGDVTFTLVHLMGGRMVDILVEEPGKGTYLDCVKNIIVNSKYIGFFDVFGSLIHTIERD